VRKEYTRTVEVRDEEEDEVGVDAEKTRRGRSEW
jgi:hypothetical protein